MKTSITLTDVTKNLLDSLSEQEGMPRSQIITLALKKYKKNVDSDKNTQEMLSKLSDKLDTLISIVAKL